MLEALLYIASGRDRFLRRERGSLTLAHDDACALIVSVATGALDDVPAIASALQIGTTSRPQAH